MQIRVNQWLGRYVCFINKNFVARGLADVVCVLNEDRPILPQRAPSDRGKNLSENSARSVAGRRWYLHAHFVGVIPEKAVTCVTLKKRQKEKGTRLKKMAMVSGLRSPMISSRVVSWTSVNSVAILPVVRHAFSIGAIRKKLSLASSCHPKEEANGKGARGKKTGNVLFHETGFTRFQDSCAEICSSYQSCPFIAASRSLCAFSIGVNRKKPSMRHMRHATEKEKGDGKGELGKWAKGNDGGFRCSCCLSFAFFAPRVCDPLR